MDKLVTIGLVTYNGAEHMMGALNSLLNQNYKNFELIISDNASTDDTEKVCRGYASRDSRIRYIRQNKNLGQRGNFFAVSQEARGEYFMWAADDDWWHPSFISFLKNALDKNPKCGVAMSSYERVFDDGAVKDKIIFSGGNIITGLDHIKVLTRLLSEAPIHKFHYGLFRADLLKKLMKRPWPECKAMDRVFTCEAALAAQFCSVPEILYKITVYRKPASERYTQDIASFYFTPRRHSRYVFTMVGRLISSPAAPLGRKLKILPKVLPVFIWQNRVFLRELFPNLFEFALKLKRLAKSYNFYD